MRNHLLGVNWSSTEDLNLHLFVLIYCNDAFFQEVVIIVVEPHFLHEVSPVFLICLHLVFVHLKPRMLFGSTTHYHEPVQKAIHQYQQKIRTTQVEWCVGGSGWTRTNGVSKVTDLQSAASA